MNNDDENLLKEAQKTDYSFNFQKKNGIYIAQTQMHYSAFVKFRKNNDIVAEITKKQTNFEIIRSQLKQESSFKSKFTLVIDIENVFLSRVDLDDEDDVYKLKNCKDLDRNFIIL